jgi:hypothetical protein
MFEDMAVRRFSDATQRNYIRNVAELAKFLGRSPDTATADDVRRFQVDITKGGARPSTLNSASNGSGAGEGRGSGRWRGRQTRAVHAELLW